ncbi:hypothetical protein KUV62_06720 [Salipiger bermudensis]|uniref:hypothetical protein n=1 Tax=Salipiger bermudensis TaxID=344736 RepID=UPI001C9963D4|nr:hypothetical protein [Salipiger bermudensis]MBY6003592.1 hypothetical protein [Salipiger bermudensis]
MTVLARPASLLHLARAFLPRRSRVDTYAALAASAKAAPPRPRDTVAPTRLHIPVRGSSPDASDCESLRLAGRYLARQEEWARLSDQLREADTARAATKGGVPIALLLAEGACSDVVETALAAVAETDPTTARRTLFCLHDAVDRLGEDPWLSCAVARAHLTLAEAWLMAPGGQEAAALRADARSQHLETAARLIAPFHPLEYDSAGIAALRCALLDLDPRPSRRVADEYEDLIDLDPGCPAHMRALGRDLMPSRFGNWDRLEIEARRTAGRTADVWGAGGYVWVWLDALSGAHQRGFAHVDAELFTEGLHDILTRRPDQHTANLLAAFCGMTLSGASEPSSARARISGCFGWIVEDHLREIHPALWASSRPFACKTEGGERLRLGESRARSALAEHFAHQLRLGREVHFTDSGVTLSPAPCASSTLAPSAALAYPRRELRDEETPCLT